MSETTVQELDLTAISKRYFAAWAARDADAIVALHTEDTRFWTHMGGEPVVGRAAVRATFAETFEQFPGFTWETYRVLYGEDHWILDWALISGDIRFDCLDVVNVEHDPRRDPLLRIDLNDVKHLGVEVLRPLIWPQPSCPTEE